MIGERILVVVAHPDDEVLGCGATIARAVDEGKRVDVMVLCFRHLYTEFVEAQHILGYQKYIETPIKVHDNEFDAVPLYKLIVEIERAIQVCDPDTLITHGPGDVNQDHRRVYEAARVAGRFLPDSSLRSFLTMEVPSTTEQGAGFQPNYFVTISGRHWSRKLAALEKYTSEERSFPHPRSPTAIAALARHRGSTVGAWLAEAFRVERIRV